MSGQLSRLAALDKRAAPFLARTNGFATSKARGSRLSGKTPKLSLSTVKLGHSKAANRHSRASATTTAAATSDDIFVIYGPSRATRSMLSSHCKGRRPGRRKHISAYTVVDRLRPDLAWPRLASRPPANNIHALLLWPSVVVVCNCFPNGTGTPNIDRT